VTSFEAPRIPSPAALCFLRGGYGPWLIAIPLPQLSGGNRNPSAISAAASNYPQEYVARLKIEANGAYDKFDDMQK
jgi:hypothetical protein